MLLATQNANRPFSHGTAKTAKPNRKNRNIASICGTTENSKRQKKMATRHDHQCAMKWNPLPTRWQTAMENGNLDKLLRATRCTMVRHERAGVRVLTDHHCDDQSKTNHGEPKDQPSTMTPRNTTLTRTPFPASRLEEWKYLEFGVQNALCHVHATICDRFTKYTDIHVQEFHPQESQTLKCRK